MHFEEKWKAERERKAFLALDDGTVFRGVAFGAKKDMLGEVVFNTGMCGYQEILTDPSYAGQFVVLTTAEVGNYGVNGADTESRALFLSGLVIGDLSSPSNWRSEKSLGDCLAENGVPGIYGVDTRALTLHIREHGNRKAYLCAGAGADAGGSQFTATDPDAINCVPPDPDAINCVPPDPDAINCVPPDPDAMNCVPPDSDAMNCVPPEETAITRAREWVGLDGQDYAAKVTCEKAYEFIPRLTPRVSCQHAGKDMSHETLDETKVVPRIVCYDFGVKTNILRALAEWARVTVVPAKTPAEDVLSMKPDGVFLSNGPADPAAVTYAIDNIRKLLGIEALTQRHRGDTETQGTKNLCASETLSLCAKRIPIMGICLGHQLLSLACGARTARLKFGHHGCNHPVKNLATGKVEITSQNHNFAVVPESVPDCLEVTHINLNDGSIEGVRHKTLPAFSVQYHPESCPGPHDSDYLFAQFREMVFDNRQPASGNGCR